MAATTRSLDPRTRLTPASGARPAALHRQPQALIPQPVPRCAGGAAEGSAVHGCAGWAAVRRRIPPAVPCSGHRLPAQERGSRGCTSPLSEANTTSWARSRALTLAIARLTWVLAVVGLT